MSMLSKDETIKGKMNTVKKILVQKKKEEAKGKNQQTSKAPFSFVICYNCRGKGHIIKSCMSASSVVSKKIE